MQSSNVVISTTTKRLRRITKKQKKAIESARAAPSLLDGTGAKAKRSCKKKTREAKKDATAKAPYSKSDAKEANDSPEANDNPMKASFLEDLEKAKQAQRTAKGVMTIAASKMFSFYSNLLSPESKYAWNKIVREQTESDPYVNLQGDTLQGPRGMSRQLFCDCVMFYLLTAFPINAAEQEKYYITNVLKKPQRINIRQFVRQVEQLNAYIKQMPCFYYSPNANASTKPENVPFPEAELGAHVLRMCPLQWQDQYNLNKQGMTPLDMCSLLTSLEAIERVCTPEKGKQEEKAQKASFNGKKGRKGLVPNLRPVSRRKSILRKVATSARSMGAHIRPIVPTSVVSMRKMERKNPVTVPLRKAVRKVIPPSRTSLS